jgi:hypothetical protein
VFRHFPLEEIHPHARAAATAAEAAGAQTDFWKMHEYLFEHQKALSPLTFANTPPSWDSTLNFLSETGRRRTLLGASNVISPAANGVKSRARRPST